MPYVTIEEEVWVDLADFETEDLIDEIKSRKGSTVALDAGPSVRELVNDIYMARHVRKQPYDHLVDQLISIVLERVV